MKKIIKLDLMTLFWFTKKNTHSGQIKDNGKEIYKSGFGGGFTSDCQV
jgi:hypothetical protein